MKYDEICSALKKHFKPKPLVIAERFRFYKKNQSPTESVLQYIAELKKLASTCDFGLFLNEALRDRFVCGLSNAAIQKKLLTEVDLDMAKALRIASAMEMAARDLTELQGGEQAAAATTGTRHNITLIYINIY